jgi:hypothetical protein
MVKDRFDKAEDAQNFYDPREADDYAEKLRNAAKGWIGVDLDGTLFHYDKWVGWNVFGEPIAPMVERVRKWVSEGIEVRIVTARVGIPVWGGYTDAPRVSHVLKHQCRVTGDMFSDASMIRAIQDHLERHGLPRLKVQCYKDVDMIELWDDRAVQVVPNTGRTLAEEHAAELSALQGKAQGVSS